MNKFINQHQNTPKYQKPFKRSLVTWRMTIIIVILSVTMIGCLPPQTLKTYEGPQRAKQEHSLIITESSHEHKVLQALDDRLFITHIDGRSTDRPFLTLASSRYPESVYVLPGKHIIKFLWGNGGYIAYGEFSFEAQAGRDYRIRQLPNSKKVSIWVEDVLSGQRIAIDVITENQ